MANNGIPFVKVRNSRGNGNYHNNNYRNNRPQTDVRDQVPAHYKAVVNSLKMNADLRRLCGIAIGQVLKSNGNIAKDEKVYVKFLWNKFSVKFAGMNREHSYTESFFMSSYIAACQAMSQANVALLNYFSEQTLEKPLDKVTNNEEVAEITNLVINYLNSSNAEETEDNTEEDGEQ